MKKYYPATLLALLSACLLSACTTAKPLVAETDFDPAFDFTGVRKIAIQPVNRMNAAAILISDMDVNRLNLAFSNELTAMGYEIVKENSAADMYLVWHLVTEEQTDVRSYNSMSYYNCWRCGPAVSDISVRQYTVGMLIVDMVDPGRGQSVWRATVQSKLQSNPSAQDSEVLRMQASQAIFSQFPPH